MAALPDIVTKVKEASGKDDLDQGYGLRGNRNDNRLCLAWALKKAASRPRLPKSVMASLERTCDEPGVI